MRDKLSSDFIRIVGIKVISVNFNFLYTIKGYFSIVFNLITTSLFNLPVITFISDLERNFLRFVRGLKIIVKSTIKLTGGSYEKVLIYNFFHFLICRLWWRLCIFKYLRIWSEWISYPQLNYSNWTNSSKYKWKY